MTVCSIIFSLEMYSVLIGQSVSHDYDQLKFGSNFLTCHSRRTKKKKKSFYFVYNMLANPETKQLNGVKILHKLNINYLPIFTNISPMTPSHAYSYYPQTTSHLS